MAAKGKAAKEDAAPARPIVIKRGGAPKHAHHGGAWKLAYADFMTALMAFFLLLWLLSSVNTAELAGIADYFKMPLREALLGGKKVSEGSSIINGGGTDLSRQNGDATTAAGRRTPSETSINPTKDADDQERLRELKAKLEAAVASNPQLSPYQQNIRIEITPDGLRIQIVDTQNRPMFATASAIVEPYMQQILREIGKSLNDLPNHVMLSGHTDAQQYSGGDKGYSNWELSADRANASRRELIAGGMDEGKVLRVVGVASTQDLDRDNPLDPVNRRISIIVLNRLAEAAIRRDEQMKTESIQNKTGGANGVATGLVQLAPPH
ncbi:flagellar motor protein MotB [Pararobbsia alpina]|uniref:Motility protein B n=1 Tax=Pararobbsia alpina TaxID=621374 RepID=A0A6S7AX86_9BURK|nr:flagellar motor protein MotB [Pararobbsia alpina]CAB3778622.1 Motility protein B [Pararobbsia alpina]